jgi:hypothetical protein
MRIYRLLVAFDALTILVLAYFFLDGLQYTITADYLSLWLMLLGVPIAVFVAGLFLAQSGKRGMASLLLGLLAVPPLLVIVFFGVLIVATPDWR